MTIEVPFEKITGLLNQSFYIYNQNIDKIGKASILKDNSIDTEVDEYILSINNYPEFLNKTVSIKVDDDKDYYIELVNWHEDTHNIYASDQKFFIDLLK
jgi:hypothetical protein